MMTSKAYAENYKLIQWAPLKPSAPKQAEEKGQGAYFMPDIKEFVSPMSGRLISSRKHLRDEERAYNVKQCGELKAPSDFDNSHRLNEAPNERRVSEAYAAALQKLGL